MCTFCYRCVVVESYQLDHGHAFGYYTPSWYGSVHGVSVTGNATAVGKIGSICIIKLIHNTHKTRCIFVAMWTAQRELMRFIYQNYAVFHWPWSTDINVIPWLYTQKISVMYMYSALKFMNGNLIWQWLDMVWMCEDWCRCVWPTVYPKKYAHGFVVLCFVVIM